MPFSLRALISDMMLSVLITGFGFLACLKVKKGFYYP